MTEVKRLNEIAKIVCRSYGVTLTDLRIKCRERELVTPRHVFFFVARMTGHNLESIGQFVNRSHSTVLRACEAMENDMRHYPQFAERVYEILRQARMAFVAEATPTTIARYGYVAL